MLKELPQMVMELLKEKVVLPRLSAVKRRVSA